MMETKEEACPKCGSASPRRKIGKGGLCLNVSGCESRACRRRAEEDRKRFKGKHWVQCFATRGQTSISFCELGEGHEGPHQRGTVQWTGNERHPIASLLREAIR